MMKPLINVVRVESLPASLIAQRPETRLLRLIYSLFTNRI